MSHKNLHEESMEGDEEDQIIKENGNKTPSNNSTPNQVKSFTKSNIQQKTPSLIPVRVEEDSSKSKIPAEKYIPIKPPEKPSPTKVKEKPSAKKPEWNFGTKPAKSTPNFQRKSRTTNVGRSAHSSEQKLTQRPVTRRAEIKPNDDSSSDEESEVSEESSSEILTPEESATSPKFVVKCNENSVSSCSMIVIQSGVSMASTKSKYDSQSELGILEESPPPSMMSLKSRQREESPPPSVRSSEILQLEEEIARLEQELAAEEEQSRLSLEVEIQERTPEEIQEEMVQDTLVKHTEESRVIPREESNEEEDMDLNANNLDEEVNEVASIEEIGQASSEIFFAISNQSSVIEVRAQPSQSYDAPSGHQVQVQPNQISTAASGQVGIQQVDSQSSPSRQNVVLAQISTSPSGQVGVQVDPQSSPSGQVGVQAQPNQNSDAPVGHDDEVQDQDLDEDLEQNHALDSPRSIFSNILIYDCLESIMNVPNLPVDKPKMATRLSVPNRIVFKKEGNRIYKGKFTIKNVSDAHMTFRVYSTDCVSILTKPEMGILKPRSEVEFDAMCCCPELLGERVAIFGFPIYSSRQFTIEATNVLWKAFRTARFPERYAEEHSTILVPATWSLLDDLNIYRNTKKMFTMEKEKPLQWPTETVNDLNITKFNRFWIVDNDIWRNIIFENAEMNSNRNLEKIKVQEKMNQYNYMSRIYFASFVVFCFGFVLVNFFNPDLFEKDFFPRAQTPLLPQLPKEPEGWFSYFKSLFEKKQD